MLDTEIRKSWVDCFVVVQLADPVRWLGFAGKAYEGLFMRLFLPLRERVPVMEDDLQA